MSKEKIKQHSSVTREKLVYVVATNRGLADSCERLLNHVNQHPEIDGDLVKVFGITPPPPQPGS